MSGYGYNEWGKYASEADLTSLRDYSMKELGDVKKALKEKKEDLTKIRDKIMMQDDLIGSMKNLLEVKNQEMKEMQHIAAIRHEKSMMPTATTSRILNNIDAKMAVEKDANKLNTKIDSMRHVVSRMEDHRKHIVDWLVNKYKKEFIAFLARAIPDKAETPQAHLESMAEECSILEHLIKEAITLVSNAAFDRDLTEKAKVWLNYGLGRIADLFDEIARLRFVMANSPRSASLDGIKECLKNIESAINSIPSMVTQTTNEYIHEEMRKLEIKDQ